MKFFSFDCFFFSFFSFKRAVVFMGNQTSLLITSNSIPLRLIFCESVFVIQQEEEEEEDKGEA